MLKPNSRAKALVLRVLRCAVGCPIPAIGSILLMDSHLLFISIMATLWPMCGNRPLAPVLSFKAPIPTLHFSRDTYLFGSKIDFACIENEFGRCVTVE